MKKLFLVCSLMVFLANQVSAQTANPNFIYLDTNKLFKSSLTITFTTGTTALGRQLIQGTQRHLNLVGNTSHFKVDIRWYFRHQNAAYLSYQNLIPI